MKILDGKQLAGFIKERQARQVRGLGNERPPKLAIVQLLDDPVINTYVSLKQRYGADIGVEVEIHNDRNDVENLIKDLNDDDTVDGIIVQLPLPKELDQQKILNLVNAAKDVDGLANKTNFDPATPTAILWLLAGYNVDLRGKKIAMVGQGALVGAPLSRILENSGLEVIRIDEGTANLEKLLSGVDVVITATGSPELIAPNMLKEKAIVVDAGVAVDKGTTKGDLDPAVYERDDLTVTPQKGGVGPLTVCALFENVITARTF